AGLTLHDRQIVPPVVDRLARPIVGAVDDAAMLTDDLAFRSDHDTIRIDPQAHWSIGERGRHAVAIALQMDEAGRSDPLRIFDEAVEWPRNWHQSWCFLSPYVGDGAAHLAMRGLCPERLASKLKPVVQGLKGWKARNRLKEPMTCILNVLLDLALLPAGRGIAKFGLEEVVAGHRHEADVDVALLATAHLVDCRAHVVVDATARNAAKHAEGMIVGVEQHLMGLEEIGTDDKGPAVAKLRMRHLQLGALIADDRPVLRPVELEGFSGLESQRHECPASCRL